MTTRSAAPFLVLATQNPIELEGTFPLPEAQLDRFLLRLRLGYPSAADEDAILLPLRGRRTRSTTLQPVVDAAELVRMSALRCRPSTASRRCARYVVALARATRAHAAVELGASPRATLALFRAARALAAIRGRDYVLPDDVKQLAPAVLAHRVTAELAVAPARPRRRGARARASLDELPVPVEGKMRAGAPHMREMAR